MAGAVTPLWHRVGVFDSPSDWALENGVRIGIILILGIVLHLLAKRAIPHAVGVALQPRLGPDATPSEVLELERDQRAATVSRVFVRTADAVIAVVVLFLVLAEIGVSLAPLIAGAGVAGIAVAFGAQSLVRDALAGAFVLLEDHYRTGDIVTLAGVTGKVEDVTLRRSLVRDLDGVLHSIPNGEIAVASNHTRAWSGINMLVGVGYGEDIAHAREVIDRVGAEVAADEQWRDDVLEPAAVARVEEFAESSIELRVVAKTKPHRQWDVASELRKRIRDAFEREGIEIPFPHRVVISREETE